ncbi:MAG: agmatine deiminase family protein, partial [Flavobacteriales bacterium]
MADGPQIEANLQYVLSNFTTKWGTPFDVIRIPSPPEQGGGYPNQNGDYLTYSNAVFVNNTVILPTYYQQYDTTAIRIWEEALPGYNIVGIDCDGGNSNIIALSGAIHCITHSVGVEDPLLISHQPLDDTEDTVNPYPVEALIQHRSGIDSARLFWRLAGETAYNEVAMTAGADDMWSADIPAQAEGSDVQYYVEATSVSGKTQDRPMPAPEGYWPFRVGEIVVNGLDDVPAFAGFQPAFPNPASAITCVPVELSRAARGRIA